MLLDAALESEREKYEQCPVLPDAAPGYQEARAWGYVVAGYFLLEESFKALLFLRGCPEEKIPTKHSLTTLFGLLKHDDQDVLREYYSDYQATIGGYRSSLPFRTLDDFLENLDGDPNQRGTDRVGSFDWRYFLIEEAKSKKRPFISIHYLYEVAYGCNQIAKSIHYGNVNPLQDTHSWRMYWSRQEKYRGWLTARMNSQGWSELSDRSEILWGPDYRGRYDFLVFRGQTTDHFFSVLPENSMLPVFDKRQELEEYDVGGEAEPLS